MVDTPGYVSDIANNMRPYDASVLTEAEVCLYLSKPSHVQMFLYPGHPKPVLSCHGEGPGCGYFLLWQPNHYGWVVGWGGVVNILLYAGYERDRSMTLLDFISMIGGCFGLFMGFSLVSFIELLYWLVIRGFRT